MLRRRGVQTLELVVAIPVLLVVTLAIIEFGFLLALEESVVMAATEATREVTKIPGASLDMRRDVAVATANRFLAPHQVQIVVSGIQETSNLRIDIQGDTRTANALVCNPKTGSPALLANEVRVTVCVRPTNAANLRPVPNWLRNLGFNLAGREVTASLVMPNE